MIHILITIATRCENSFSKLTLILAYQQASTPRQDKIILNRLRDFAPNSEMVTVEKVNFAELIYQFDHAQYGAQRDLFLQMSSLI